MNLFRGIGEIVYPYGNSARAVVTGYDRSGKITVRFLDDCIADFGWYRWLIYWKGYRLDIAPEHLHDEPRKDNP